MARFASAGPIVAGVAAASSYGFYATASHEASTAGIGEAASAAFGLLLGLLVGAAIVRGLLYRRDPVARSSLRASAALP
jgi:Na+/glutamate symporter